jgi:hypothetical protein
MIIWYEMWDWLNMYSIFLVPQEHALVMYLQLTSAYASDWSP